MQTHSSPSLLGQSHQSVFLVYSTCSQGLPGTLEDGGTEKPFHMGTVAAQDVLHQVLCQRLLSGHHCKPHLRQR